MRITLIDNYDSFTWNLVHALGMQGAEVSVHRNDAVSVAEVLAAAPEGIVLSPGPCTPREAGICCALVEAAEAEAVPLLGVCLGHQAIGQVFGGEVARAPAPMHGKVSLIHHRARGLFRGLNGPIPATRYHSLVVTRASMPAALDITAETDDGLVMGLAHRALPLHGVQFHPESILTEAGPQLLANFLALAREWRLAQRQPAAMPA
jgi:anthranilate synthase component 2